MPRRKQDRPKRMKYSEDGKEEEEGEQDAATGEEEEDDDQQDEGDAASDDSSEEPKPAEETMDEKVAESVSEPTPPKSPESVPEIPQPASPPKDPGPSSPKSPVAPAPAAVPAPDPGPGPPPSLPLPLPLPLPMPPPSTALPKPAQDKPAPLLPDEPLEELAERPLSSLENMSKAIEQKIPSVFEKYQSPRLKEAVKLPYKPAKVIKEMPSRPHHHSSSSSHSKSKDRGNPLKGQTVPPSMSRHTAPAARSYPPPASKAFMETDQPLDLSKKPKTESPNKATDTKTYTSKSSYQYTPLPPSNSNPSSGSSLSNLEKRFGGNSFLFDGASGKLNAPKNPLYQAFGGNLFATALYNTPPLASTDQVYRPHYRNYWPGPIPTPRHTAKPSTAPSSSVASNTKSHHHQQEPSKSNSLDHGVRKEEQSSSIAGTSGGPGANGKYTNLICNCKKQFETLYELTIHMQNTSHTPLPCKNGDQGEYPKLVRGQDMWLNQGMEQTRQILRCMQCGESFKSLPELTIHMMKTRHYTNIVGAESRKIHKYTSYYSDNEEEDGGSVFCCKVCNESFKDMDGLANHMVVSGHHKKHVLKSSSHGGSASIETFGGHSSSVTGNHESKSQSPKPAGIPVAPSNLAHSYRSSKSPTATVATLLESQRSLTNGTKGDSNSGDRHTPERKRKLSSSRQDDWKNKLIKSEKKEDSSVNVDAKNENLVKDMTDFTKISALKDTSENSCKTDGDSSIDQPVVKSEVLDSNDADDDDSMKGEIPDMNKIRCENCGERIETPKFVEHVRACVKISSDDRHSSDESKEAGEETALNLKRYPSLDTQPADRSNDYPHPLEYIPYKKRGRYEEAVIKSKEQDQPKSSESGQLFFQPQFRQDPQKPVSNLEEMLQLDLTKVKRERSISPPDLRARSPHQERPKSQDVNSQRFKDLERYNLSARPASSEPLRPWSMDKLERLTSREYPPRPRSNEEATRPRSRESFSRPLSSDAVLQTRSYEPKEMDLSFSHKKLSVKDPPKSPLAKEQLAKPVPIEQNSTSSAKHHQPKSPVLHSTTGSLLPDVPSEGSALKAMENFIERSFISNSNKPSFYRSNPLNGRMGGLSMGGLSRMDCPLPDSTAQHVEAYSAQHKYLPPSLPTNLKVEKPESQKEVPHSPKIKVEVETPETVAKPNGKPEEADSSDTDARDKSDSSPKALHQKYLADGGSPEGEKSSALQSLQGLVYGKSFSTEHPLDSLQKLIHNTDTPTSTARPNGSQQTYVTGMATLQQQGLPSTVILVNPIVTVMPTTSSAASAVHINISRDSSPPTADQCSPTSSTPSKNSPVGDIDGDQAGDFRCQACNRTFASKGSYRYHLSRCHLSSVKRYGIKEAFNMSPYVYLPLDHTAKFNEYYEMANELANKGK